MSYTKPLNISTEHNSMEVHYVLGFFTFLVSWLVVKNCFAENEKINSYLSPVGACLEIPKDTVLYCQTHSF